MKIIKKMWKLLWRTRGFEKVFRAHLDSIGGINFLTQKEVKGGLYVMPQRGTEKSAGYDFTLPHDVYIEPNQVVKVKSGYKAYMKKGEVLKFFPRSSTSINLRVTLANDTPIIDSDFYNNPKNEGEITLALLNEGDKPIRIEKGERVAQAIFEKYLIADNDIPKSKKRVGGIGSTNK